MKLLLLLLSLLPPGDLSPLLFLLPLAPEEPRSQEHLDGVTSLVERHREHLRAFCVRAGTLADNSYTFMEGSWSYTDFHWERANLARLPNLPNEGWKDCLPSKETLQDRLRFNREVQTTLKSSLELYDPLYWDRGKAYSQALEEARDQEKTLTEGVNAHNGDTLLSRRESLDYLARKMGARRVQRGDLGPWAPLWIFRTRP